MHDAELRLCIKNLLETFEGNVVTGMLVARESGTAMQKSLDTVNSMHRIAVVHRTSGDAANKIKVEPEHNPPRAQRISLRSHHVRHTRPGRRTS